MATEVRKYQIAFGVTVALLLVSALFVFRLRQVVPITAANLADNRLQNYQTLMDSHLKTGTALVSRVYVFCGNLIEQSPRTQKILREWTGLKGDLGHISNDVLLLKTKPVEAAKRLIGNGPERIQNIVRQTVQLATEIANLIPETINALKSAGASDSDTAQIQRFEKLVMNFIGTDPKLLGEWNTLKNDIESFIKQVQQDFESAKASLSQNRLESDFYEELWTQFF